MFINVHNNEMCLSKNKCKLNVVFTDIRTESIDPHYQLIGHPFDAIFADYGNIILVACTKHAAEYNMKVIC